MKKFCSVSLILFLLTAVMGCNLSNYYVKNIKNWVPKEYNPKESILLIEKFPGKSKFTESFIAERFPYRYEIVSREDIIKGNDKYADKKLYRFGLLWSEVVSYAMLSSAYVRADMDWDGSFYDRVTGVESRKTGRTNAFVNWSYKPVINTIVKYFEKNGMPK